MSAGSTLRDRVWMSVSGTPGTGAVTLGSALTNYQSASAAGVVNGETNTWLFIDGSAWELSACVYTASGTSLARTLIASSTGSLLSLTSSATALITAASRDLSNAAVAQFLDGPDGNVTISSSVTLTRDMAYNNLTLAAGAALNTNGWRIYVANNLDISNAPAGAIFCNGGAGGAAASTAAGGAGGATAYSGGTTYGFASAAANGNAGGTTTGTAAGNGSTTGQTNGGVGGGAGAGGLGSSGAGGAAGTAGVSAGGILIPLGPQVVLDYLTTSRTWVSTFSALAGSKGGSGGGNGTVAGGASGGAGASAGAVFIMARNIIRGASTAAGAIQAKGGSAGAGFAPTTGNCGGAGGSSGGGGGVVIIGVGSLLGATAANCIDVSGGDGAPGTNGFGTGIGGDGGGSGQSGIAVILNMQAGSLTRSAQAAVVAGSAHSGITGGAKGTATVTQVSL